jgi:hypothetical protein
MSLVCREYRENFNYNSAVVQCKPLYSTDYAIIITIITNRRLLIATTSVT